MADHKIRIEALFELEDRISRNLRGITSQSGRTGKALAGVERHVKGIKRAAIGLPMALGVGLGARGVMKFLQGLVGVNQQLEMSKLGFGGLLEQARLMKFPVGKEVVDFNSSLKKGGELFWSLQRYAAQAVGVTEQYADTWRILLQPVMSAGGGMQDVMDITKLLVPTAKMLGMDMNIATISIQQALLGMIDARDRLIKMLGFSTRGVIKLAKEGKVLDAILTALRRNEKSAEAFGTTFEARLDTLRDKWWQIRRVMGEPLFAKVRGEMDRIIEYVTKNQKAVEKWAVSVGRSIEKAFDGAVRAGNFLAKNWEGIVDTVKILAEVWIAKKLAGALLGVLKIATSLRTAMTLTGGGAAVAGAAGGVGALAFIGATAAVLSWMEFFLQLKELNDVAKENSADRLTNRQLAEQARIQKGELYRRFLPGGQEGLLTAQVMESWHKKGREINEAARKSVEFQADLADKIVNWMNMIGWDAERIRKAILEQRGFLAPEYGIHDFTELGMKLPAEKKKAPPVNVNIQKITIDARHLDPNRVYRTMVDTAAKEATRRTQPRTALEDFRAA